MSIYGKTFSDENFDLKHVYGALSMANSGPNTNNSQFLIVLNRNGAEWLDGEHVVFGRVLKGFEVLDDIEKYGTESGIPTKRITVVDCGELDETSILYHENDRRDEKK